MPEAKVLIIDDELQVRRILRLTLESNGFSVVDAASGKEGVYLAAVEHPDIVLLDLGLPDMDGVAVRRAAHWCPRRAHRSHACRITAYRETGGAGGIPERRAHNRLCYAPRHARRFRAQAYRYGI